MTEVRSTALFALSGAAGEALLRQYEYPWQALGALKSYVRGLALSLFGKPGWRMWGEEIAVAEDVVIPPSAVLLGPAVIYPGTELRPGAYLRGSVLVGRECVIGNSTELKNCILLGDVKVPHYNYVGDSVLGWHTHMGAGSIASNLKTDGSDVVIRDRRTGEAMDTHRRKLGAILGDGADVGCQCVLNPGTVIGKGTSVYPMTALRGVYPPGCIVKGTDTVVPREVRDG